jgi:hypothetical protein
MMMQRLLFFLNKRMWLIVAIGVLLLLLVILFPFPLDEEQLTNTRWCTPSVKDAHFQFDQRGEFYYGAKIFSADGGESVGGQGKWESRGTFIHVVVDKSNIHEEGYSFTIRPLLLGYVLWSTVDFGGALILMPIWRPCN